LGLISNVFKNRPREKSKRRVHEKEVKAIFRNIDYFSWLVGFLSKCI